MYINTYFTDAATHKKFVKRWIYHKNKFAASVVFFMFKKNTLNFVHMCNKQILYLINVIALRFIASLKLKHRVQMCCNNKICSFAVQQSFRNSAVVVDLMQTIKNEVSRV